MKKGIPRREFLRRSGIGTAVAALSVNEQSTFAHSGEPSLERRMNVVYVISDQHQAACTG